jgi:hypothetical protein
MSVTYSAQITGSLYVYAIDGAPLGDREIDDVVRRVPAQALLVQLRLRDVPVLAELAAQVAARGAEAEHRRAREEMVERLLLDRIDREAGRSAVAELDQLPAAVLADEAEPGLTVGHPAVPRTERAQDAPVGLGLPPARRRRRVGVRVSTAFHR